MPHSVGDRPTRGGCIRPAYRYLPPKYILGLRSLLDGGVVRNNPTVVGLSESWAMALGAKPDFVINLGTGSSPGSGLADERPHGLWRYNWLPRLVQAYLSHLQGQRTWNDVTCLVKKETRRNSYYRLDITIQGKFGLDDIKAMPRLRSLVYQDAMLRHTIAELARRLFATLFYFKLTVVPTRTGSRFRVQGNILYLRKARDPALPLIIRRLQSSILLINGEATGFSLMEDVHGNIMATLVFVGSPSISLELKEEQLNVAFPLSGSPYLLTDLVFHGGLAAPFGTRTYKRKAEFEFSGHQVQWRRLA
ncbi:hypothetical protein F5Y02DRAFT_69890 [Annulohypoxylon stygium]|nr:hypothetical protein F5Y02DRAFT_69890 [Annulohypoxylon stygium]